MDCTTPGLPVLHHLLEFAQVHFQWIRDAIQPSYPLLPSSPSTFSLSQHQGCFLFFQWVTWSHQVAKVLELQLQHQSFQWVFRVDFLYAWLVWSPRDSQESSPAPQFERNNSLALRLLYGAALTSMHDYLKDHSLDCTDIYLWYDVFALNTLSGFVIPFLPRRNHLISWLQSPSAVILEPKKRKSITASTSFPSICLELMGLDALILIFFNVEFFFCGVCYNFIILHVAVLFFRHQLLKRLYFLHWILLAPLS